MADMIVAGAGTTAVNGTYVENGTYEGNYQYVKSDGNLIRCAGGGNWVIGASNIYFDPDYGWQGTLWYRSNAYAKTPDNLTYTRISAGTFVQEISGADVNCQDDDGKWLGRY